MFLQTIGLLPDNVIVLSTTREKTDRRISEKIKLHDHFVKNLPHLVKESSDQYDLSLKAVKSIFQGFYSEINTEDKSKELVLEELAKIIKFKNRCTSSRKPPRLLLLGPPCSKKYEIAEYIARKFNITHISLSDLLHKEIAAKNDNSAAILNSINSGELSNK